MTNIMKYADNRSTDGLIFTASYDDEGYELRVNGKLYDVGEVDADVIINDILSIRNGFDWGKEAAGKAKEPDDKPVYAFVVSNLNPSEFAPNVSLAPTADYEQVVKMLKEQFLFDLDLEVNEGNGVVNMAESGWHDDENYGDIVFCDDSRTRYEVVSLSDWSQEDLDRAEKAERQMKRRGFLYGAPFCCACIGTAYVSDVSMYVFSKGELNMTKEKAITKTFWFKHINWEPDREKPGRAAVEVTLTYKDKGPCLSISASVYSWHAKEPFMCGQCLNELESTSLKDNDLFQELYGYWKKYHLNDLHAGTPKQEACINAAIKSGELPRYEYSAACDLLDEKGLLFDDDYKYGTGWLYEPIPADVLARIEAIINA